MIDYCWKEQEIRSKEQGKTRGVGLKLQEGTERECMRGPGEQEGCAKEAQSTHCRNQQWFTRKSDVCISLRAAAEIRLASNSELSVELRVI